MTTHLTAEVANRAVDDQVRPERLYQVPGLDVVQRIDDDWPPRTHRTNTLAERFSGSC